MPRLLIPIGAKDHVRNAKEETLTLLEYGDYQCPFCAQAYTIFKELQKKMKKELRFAFRNFPLKQAHPYALAAAEAAEAAALQDKFWEMHDYLYEHQRLFAPDAFLSFAEQLGLDLAQFKQDVQSQAVRGKIEEDFKNGILSGVNGTPCIYINDERYDGGISLEALTQVLEAALKP